MRASDGARAPRKPAAADSAHDVPGIGGGVIVRAIAALLLAVVAAQAVRAAEPAGAPPDSWMRPASAVADSSSPPRPTVHPMSPDSSARPPFRLVPVAELIAHGVASGQLVEPSGLTIDSFGRIYVGDAARHRVLRLDPSGIELGQTGSLGSAHGELRRPGSVALLGTLSVAVLDIENRRVLMYDVNDRLQGTLIDFDAPSLRDPLGRIEPRSLAADRGGALYVADSERDRVLAFDFSGRLARVIGGFGEAPGSFRELGAIAATRRGTLFTVERAKFRVQRLDASGVSLGTWTFADSGAARGELAAAADDSLRLAIADEAAGTVRVWDREGALIASLEGLGRPRAVAFASDGTLLIAEAGLGRLRRFRFERTPPVRPAEE